MSSKSNAFKELQIDKSADKKKKKTAAAAAAAKAAGKCLFYHTDVDQFKPYPKGEKEQLSMDQFVQKQSK